MRKKMSKEFLKCVLTEEEFKSNSSTLARTTREIRELEDQKKSVTSNYAAKINAAEAEANRIATIVSDGYEYRDVECETTFDLVLKLATTIRKDTGEVLKERPMTQDELQQELKFFAEEAVNNMDNDPSGPTEYNGVGQKALPDPNTVDAEFSESATV